MKRSPISLRRVVAAGIGVAVFAGMLPAEAGARPVTTIRTALGLAEGTSGAEVSRVQTALVSAGTALAGGIDGAFGPATARALREFQLSRGLTPSGAVDEATFRALGLAGGTVQPTLLPLSQGATGPGVRVLQQALIAAGSTNVGGTDGIFGPMTAQAVLDYQTARGIAASGRFDVATARALAAGLAPTAAPTAAANTAPAAAPAEATAATRPAPEALVGLQVGDVGPRVRDLQRALLDSGQTFLGGADGVFGPATANALRLFQSKRGLEVTGRVDDATASALTGVAPAPPANASSPLVGLAPGTTGPLVVELQRILLAAGLSFAGGADGIFGPATANALRSFQTQRGLEPTGRVDEATAAALAQVPSSSPAPTTPSTPSTPSTPPTGGTTAPGFPVFGEQGDRVRELQAALIRAGIEVPGGADGIFGTMTAGAVLNFQRSRGLEPTGVVDAATASALGLSSSTPPPPPPPSTSITLQHFPMQKPCSFIDTWHAPRGGGRLHEGTDIMGAEGLQIYAVTSGTITQMYYDREGSRAGNGLRLSMADGTYFFYAHLSGFAEGIGVGTQVTAGQILGYNGATGNAGVPHLHFEIHPGGGAAVNPYPALKAINGC